MKFLAIGALCGVSPSRLLRADPVEQAILIKVINEAQVQRQEYDQDLARMIINELARSMKRGRRS